MMGLHKSEGELFSYHINLEKRVRADHPLRMIAEKVDFSFVREEVKRFYSNTGKPSVDPEIILKLMFLLFFDDVRSERELVQIAAERLDYLWFLGLSIDDPIPDHSVLSKARKRWGPQVFEQFFARTVIQASELGLVDSGKLYIDSTLVDADASSEKTVEIDEEMWHHIIQSTERKLECFSGEEEQSDLSQQEPPIEQKPTIEQEPSQDKADGSGDQSPDQEAKTEEGKKQDTGKAPKRKTIKYNTTDPDAPLVGRKGLGKAKPRYKAHRMVDSASGVIVATESTGGDVFDGHRLLPMLGQAEYNTAKRFAAVVGDNHYATNDNYRELKARSVTPYLGARTLSGAARKKTVNDAGLPMLKIEDYTYDAAQDLYHCPGGSVLKPGKRNSKRKAVPYRSLRSVCKNCPLLGQCTTAKSQTRVILRNDDQDLLDQMMIESETPRVQRELRQRMGIGEGSFGDGSRRHGQKRARYRGLAKVGMQNHLIAAIQNIKKIITHKPRPRNKVISLLPPPAEGKVIDFATGKAVQVACDDRNKEWQSSLEPFSATNSSLLAKPRAPRPFFDNSLLFPIIW